jgi:hypothetical protein
MQEEYKSQVTFMKLSPLIVTSELLAMAVFSVETPHERFVNLLGPRGTICLSFVCIWHI